MKYRKLGSSDREVSEISLGSWLTFAGGVEFEQVRACTDAAVRPPRRHAPLSPGGHARAQGKTPGHPDPGRGTICS
jgi:hypothetical protein